MERIVRILGARIAESFLNEYLAGRIRDMVLSANNVAYLHLSIVYDDGEMVERVIDGSRYREVAQFRGIESDAAADKVGERYFLSRIPKPHDFYLHARFFFTLLFRYVRFVLGYKARKRFFVRFDEFGRSIEFIPRKAEPLPLLDDVVLVLFFAPCFVGVFAAKKSTRTTS